MPNIGTTIFNRSNAKRWVTPSRLVKPLKVYAVKHMIPIGKLDDAFGGKNLALNTPVSFLMELSNELSPRLTFIQIEICR